MQNLRNLYNQALSAVGSDPNVTDPAAETKATALLNLWYPVARRAVFTAVHWPSLRAVQRLSLASVRDESLEWANTDPAPGFKYSYAVPANMVQPQYMEDFSRFQLGRVGAENLIFSNTSLPIFSYTMDDEVPVTWEPDLYRCVVWALAACINMSKNGKMAVTQKLEQQVLDLISMAAENAANGDDTYYEAPPSFYAGTGFSFPANQDRFFYPTNTFRVGGLIT
jgi:hypothetical protein